jgi:4'-phosphopantetheinyl transferase
MDRAPRIDWPVPGAFPPLASGQVHVWCAWLDAPDADAPGLGALLSSDERARAAAFHFATDRRRYIASHALLRQVLAGYLAAESTIGGTLCPDPKSDARGLAHKAPPSASELEFASGSSGKPELLNAQLQFNLSHSGPLALLAVARDQAVGVDVEQRWEMPDLAILEERMFTPAALRRQQRLGPDLRLNGFYRRWTQLEAVGKCRGTGLALETMATGAEHLTPVDPAEGFTGCLACERAPALIAFFRYLMGMSSSLPETTASTTPILPGLPHRLEGLAPLSSA